MIRRSLLGLAAIAAAGLFIASTAALADAPSLPRGIQIEVASAEPAAGPDMQFAVAVVEVDQAVPQSVTAAAYDPPAAGRAAVAAICTAVLASDTGSLEVLPGRFIAARRTWIV